MNKIHLFIHADEYTSTLIEGFVDTFESFDLVKKRLDQIADSLGHHCTVATFNDSTQTWESVQYGFWAYNDFNPQPDFRNHWEIDN